MPIYHIKIYQQCIRKTAGFTRFLSRKLRNCKIKGTDKRNSAVLNESASIDGAHSANGCWYVIAERCGLSECIKKKL